MTNGNDIEETKRRINEEEDFIYCPRLENSIKAMINKNPNGVDDERISRVLLITEDEVKSLYNSAIKKLRKFLGIKKAQN